LNPLLRLLSPAAFHGFLSGQIVFSAAFVGACELPNWIHAPRRVNACRERWMTVSAYFTSPGCRPLLRAINQPWFLLDAG
jgi:hypothetical protein